MPPKHKPVKPVKSGAPKRKNGPTVGTHAAPAKRPRIAGVGTRNSVPQFNEPQDDEPQNDEPQGDDDFDPTALEARTEERFRQIELFQQDMYTRLVEGFDELRQAPRATPTPTGPHAQNTQLTPRLPYPTPGAPQLPGTPPPPPPADILSQVPWVDVALVQSISAGNFDIFNLPKLHRDNSLRKKHAARSIEGLVLSTGNTPQLEVINSTSRIHTYFKEIGSFYIAWLVYITIRIHFYPERAPGLLTWTGHVQQFANSNYPWNLILDYVVKYFEQYQDAPPERWMSRDPERVTTYILMPSSKPVQPAAPSPKRSPQWQQVDRMSYLNKQV